MQPRDSGSAIFFADCNDTHYTSLYAATRVAALDTQHSLVSKKSWFRVALSTVWFVVEVHPKGMACDDQHYSRCPLSALFSSSKRVSRFKLCCAWQVICSSSARMLFFLQPFRSSCITFFRTPVGFCLFSSHFSYFSALVCFVVFS